MTVAIADNFYTLYDKRALIRFLAKSRRNASFFRTQLGRFWLLLEPLANMMVYYLMLTVVFQAGPRYGVNPFIFIMLGLSHYFIIRRSIGSSCTAFSSQRSLLLQVNVAPLVFYATAFYQNLLEFLTFVGLFYVFYIFMGPGLAPSFLVLYPLALILLMLFSWSFGLMAAVINVFLRDFQHITNFALRLLLYGSPVLYGAGFLPQKYYGIYMLNPLAPVFSLLHSAFFGTPLPETAYIIWAAAIILAGFFISHLMYNRLAKKFTKVF